MMGGATTAPTVDPLLKIAIANARSRTGNHSATAFAAPGQFPASPTPRMKRKRPSCMTFRAVAWSMDATVQIPTKTMNPTRVPIRSSTLPDSDCEMV